MNLPFEQLSAREKELMYQAPALVTIMVAGSDGQYDQQEIEKGFDITQWKKINARPDLLPFYDEVRPRFSADLKQLKKDLPKDINERYRAISERLQALNPVLYKLEKPFAEQFYASLQELARHVAESSGGVLGYLSVGYNESKIITLPMIDDPRTHRA